MDRAKRARDGIGRGDRNFFLAEGFYRPGKNSFYCLKLSVLGAENLLRNGGDSLSGDRLRLLAVACPEPAHSPINFQFDI